MSILNIFIFISIFALTPAIFRHGLLFEHIGEVIPVSGRYIFNVNLDLEPFLNEIVLAKDKTTSLIETCQRHERSIRTTNKLISTELAVLTKTLGSIKETLNDQELDLLNFVSVLDDEQGNTHLPYRNKRELLDFVSEISKFIFGTATDKDVRQIIDHIKSIEGNQDKLINKFNTNTLIINTTLFEISDMQKKIHKLHSDLLRLENFTNEYFTDYKNTGYINLFTILAQNIITNAEGLNMKLLKTKSALLRAAGGKLDPYLFPPEYCLNFLKSVAANIGRKLPFTVSEVSLQSYFNIASTFISRKSKLVFRIIILLPLRAHPSDMELYSLQTMPTELQNSNLFMGIEPHFKFLGVSNDLNLFIPLHSLVSCLRTGRIFLCPPTFGLHSGSTNLCEVRSYRGDNNYDEFCEKKIYKNFGTIIRKTQNAYSFSIENSTTLHLNCENGNPLTIKSITLKGSGILHLPQSCSGILNNIQIPNLEDTSDHRNVSIQKISTPFLDMKLEQILKSSLKPTVLLHFNDSFEKGVNMRELSRFLSTMDTHDIHSFNSTKPFLWSSISLTTILFIICIIGIIIVWLIRTRKINIPMFLNPHTSSPQTNASIPETIVVNCSYNPTVEPVQSYDELEGIYLNKRSLPVPPPSLPPPFRKQKPKVETDVNYLPMVTYSSP